MALLHGCVQNQSRAVGRGKDDGHTGVYGKKQSSLMPNRANVSKSRAVVKTISQNVK